MCLVDVCAKRPAAAATAQGIMMGRQPAQEKQRRRVSIVRQASKPPTSRRFQHQLGRPSNRQRTTSIQTTNTPETISRRRTDIDREVAAEDLPPVVFTQNTERPLATQDELGHGFPGAEGPTITTHVSNHARQDLVGAASEGEDRHLGERGPPVGAVPLQVVDTHAGEVAVTLTSL